MKLRIEINLDTPAFYEGLDDPDDDTKVKASEIIRILGRLAQHMTFGDTIELGWSQTLCDANRKRVGRAEVKRS